MAKQQIRPDDVDPKHRWDRPLQAPGRTQVDFEERVDFRRLHDYRLARVRAALAHSGLGALLSFDQHNIRYTTSTVIGEWARDKLTRYSLLTGNGDPYIWDFGSAARHHKLHAPWLHEDHCRAGLLGLRGATGGDLTLFREALKPGVQESQIVALATKRLYEMGSDCVEAINSISGERCSPHPHNFTDRLIRPGDQAFFDIIQSFMGYRTCYYRTFNVGRATPAQRTAYRKAREWMDTTIDLLKPGVTTDRIAQSLPKAEDIGFASEMDAFGLNFCHGL